MGIASIVGLVTGFVLVIFGIVYSKDGGIDFSLLQNFLDTPSALITFGGSFFTIMAFYSISDFFGGLKSFLLIFKTPKFDTTEMIQKIIELSNVARKEGLLSLEEAAADLDDEFMKKGILLIVDGTDPELVRSIMETELNCIEERHKQNVSFWQELGGMGPAWGMIGTLIGLVNMLKNMSDAAAIGPNMAVALLTTLYGSLLANWICAPTASKLMINNSMEMMQKEIMVEGLLSIQAGENPRIIEEKLKSFMAPKDRKMQPDEGGEQDG